MEDNLKQYKVITSGEGRDDRSKITLPRTSEQMAVTFNNLRLSILATKGYGWNSVEVHELETGEVVHRYKYGEPEVAPGPENG